MREDRILYPVDKGDVITLVNHSTDEVIPVPLPQLLQLHAARAKIIHAAGAAEAFKRFFEEFEHQGTLAADGSSNELLGRALRRIAVAVQQPAYRMYHTLRHDTCHPPTLPDVRWQMS